MDFHDDDMARCKPVRRVYSIPKILALRDHLCAIWSHDCLDEFCGHAQSILLLAGASAFIPRTCCGPQLEKSLRSLLGSRLTAQVLRATAYAIAGNLHELRVGRHVRRWSVQRVREWVPVQVLAVTLPAQGDARNRFGIRVRAMAGSVAGVDMTADWSKSLCSLVASKCGFESDAIKKSTAIYADPFDLHGLRFSALVDPKYCTRDDPGFRRVAVGGASRKYNRVVLGMRFTRGAKTPCPLALPRAHSCSRCPLGLDKCPAAVRERTIVRIACACGSAFYPFDTSNKKCDKCRSER